MKKEPCNLGKAMRAGLQEKGINQSALAKQCGVTRQHISIIISGRLSPSPTLLHKIVTELEGDLEAFVMAYMTDKWHRMREKCDKQ